ncbi:tRNA(Ile)-lysidine synthase [Cerasibacillus quisquiliarum]|uniref:tRNA(Ile)-lysidine synthase n=1 Tax=Cerasibacillus quisquiliarum TaxID=227865 RepID=A0A511V0Q5_9BACI|nr:tRNA lysidine(34) synthetase TilS [Cerasibacillus quisquiliarum]MBB5146594.1 tRNA(Ile)-lysidine synthase [Cerasibacillus quisquiliarum]GEN31293.1 tRNA(Ile)-lysidine synthase [Cerasibacillus quisquiliarum]
MEQKVAQFIKRHHLLTKGSHILVGVSGGADSLALLHYLWQMRDTWNLQLTALSVDHQWRGKESKKDLESVQNICQQWHIPFIGTSLDVPTFKKQHQLNAQVASRKVRYQFFREQMESLRADALALGHHGDDQVETFVMRLIRTADSSAFQGIPVKRPFATGMIIRPFLCLTKREIEDYCERHDLHPRWDSSNDDVDYTRNYIRKTIAPLLKSKNNNIHQTVQHLSETLADDETYLKEQAEQMVQAVVSFNEKDRKAIFRVDDFTSYPTALQRRAYHLILNYLYHHLPDNLSYIHEQNFFDLLKRVRSNAEIDFPNRLKIRRTYQVITFLFEKEQSKRETVHKTLNVPDRVVLPDGSEVVAQFTEEFNDNDTFTYICALELVELPLHIRTRQAGDRMTWKGLKGTKKLKDIFIDEKIPLEKRDTWPVITDNRGHILWLVGLRKNNLKSNGTSLVQLKYKGDV